MRIRIEGFDPPGRSCGPGPDFPGGHFNVHVAVQGRKGQQDLLGLTPGDTADPVWELDCVLIRPPPETDLRGPHIQGAPGQRFIYLTWGVVDDEGGFRMFRRAKLWLREVPPDVLTAAVERGGLTARVRLADGKGQPVCATVRPPAIAWSAGKRS